MLEVYACYEQHRILLYPDTVAAADSTFRLQHSREAPAPDRRQASGCCRTYARDPANHD